MIKGSTSLAGRSGPPAPSLNCGALAVILLALPLVFGGCAALKRAKAAKDPSKIPPGERTVKAGEIGLGPDTLLTLERALEIALTYHPSVVQAQQSLVIAQSQFKDALAGYMPSVSTSAGSQWNVSSSSGGGAAGATAASSGSGSSEYSFSGNLKVSQVLVDFGQTQSAIRQAYQGRLAQEKRLLATKNDLAYQVKLAYYDLNRAEALLVVSEDTVARYQGRLDLVKALVEAGRQIKYEVTKAVVDLGGAQLGLTKARDSVKKARAALNQSLGLAESPGYKVEQAPVQEVDAGIDELMDAAAKGNPDLLALMAEEQSALAGIDGSIAALFPSISIGFGSSLGTGSASSTASWGTSVGPSFVWSLLSGLTRVNQVDQAVARLHSARAARAAQEQKIYYDLSTGLALLEDARERMKQAEELAKQAEENLAMVTELNLYGRATALELTDAQISLTQAESERVQALYDYHGAGALITHTTGGK